MQCIFDFSPNDSATTQSLNRKNIDKYLGIQETLVSPPPATRAAAKIRPKSLVGLKQLTASTSSYSPNSAATLEATSRAQCMEYGSLAARKPSLAGHLPVLNRTLTRLQQRYTEQIQSAPTTPNDGPKLPPGSQDSSPRRKNLAKFLGFHQVLSLVDIPSVLI